MKGSTEINLLFSPPPPNHHRHTACFFPQNCQSSSRLYGKQVHIEGSTFGHKSNQYLPMIDTYHSKCSVHKNEQPMCVCVCMCHLQSPPLFISFLLPTAQFAHMFLMNAHVAASSSSNCLNSTYPEPTSYYDNPPLFRPRE